MPLPQDRAVPPPEELELLGPIVLTTHDPEFDAAPDEGRCLRLPLRACSPRDRRMPLPRAGVRSIRSG